MCARVRAWVNVKIPAIALTGYGHKSDQQSTVLAGLGHYGVKPANATESIAMLAQLKPLGERVRARAKCPGKAIRCARILPLPGW